MPSDGEASGISADDFRLREWDREHSWHPFAQMKEFLSLPPLHIASGEGVWLTDTEGRSYLDATASIWTNVHGHNDPDLNAALRDQLDKVAHSTMLGLSHPVGSTFAAELAGRCPGDLKRVFFSDNGSNAVEIALKMSFQFWQLMGREGKRLVIGMSDAYHGDTFGTMAVGDSGGIHARFAPWFFPTLRFPRPICREYAGKVHFADDRESLERLRGHLEAHSEEVAAVILEPSVQGAAGMRLQPPGFLGKIADLCREYDVHLILDEVFVGFGRTGPLLVCAREEVVPDFLCLAKGLSAGYLPLAATVVREPLYEAFLGSFTSGRAFIHGHTFTGNPLAAAVSLASLRKLEGMIASGEVARKGRFFGETLADVFEGHPRVGEIRQRGLCAAIDLVPDSRSGARYPAGERRGLRVAVEARRHGLILRPIGDTLIFVPPLAMDEGEMELLAARTRSAIEETL